MIGLPTRQAMWFLTGARSTSPAGSSAATIVGRHGEGRGTTLKHYHRQGARVAPGSRQPRLCALLIEAEQVAVAREAECCGFLASHTAMLRGPPEL